jgi:serine/threonine-protein kinase
MALSESPTLTAEMTSPGVALGTAGYMSPEQARAKPVDRRVDIWAFGCVLYEMLTGRQAFPGDTVTDRLARILEREPDWEALPRETPTSVRTLLRRCLTKDPQRRLHDMGDVWLELDEVSEQAALEELGQAEMRRWPRVVPWVVALVAVGLAVWSLFEPEDRPSLPGGTHFSLASQPLAVGPHPVSPILALSRDGSLLAYVSGEGDTGRIILRRFDTFEETVVVGTDAAQAPFFSPDGRWLGFAAEGKLQKIRVDGGRVIPLCDVEVMHGAVWSSDDTIIFSGASGLVRISADGGEPVDLTREEIERGGEVGHHNPELVPGGDAVIFVTVRSGGDPLEIALFDFETGERKTLIEGGGNARFLPSEHLAYAARGRLHIVGFDRDKQEVVGSPVPVVNDLMMDFPLEPSLGHFTVSDQGALAYLSGPPVSGGSRWVWVDRAGERLRTGEFQRRLMGPKFSPDGTRLAVAAELWGQSGMHIWIEDLSRGTFSRLTFERDNWWPIWSPDGERIAFTSVEGSRSWNLFWKLVDGSGEAERLTHGELGRQPMTWSRDGAVLVFHQSLPPEPGWDVLSVAVNGEAEPQPLLSSRFEELQPELSPDGRWLAYVSDETGRSEVYVRRYPDLSDKWQLSNEGGAEPAWSSKGNELFYRNGAKLMVVEITRDGELIPGTPRELFEGNFMLDQRFGRGFDVAPDDQGFIFVEQSSVEDADVELRIVFDWLTEVERIGSTERD